MVHKIKLKDSEFDCEIGLAFLGEALDVLNLTIEELGRKVQTNPFKMVPSLIFVSAKVAAELDDKEFTITKREVIQAMEDDGGMMSQGATRFLDLLHKYMTKDVPTPEEPEPVKKKVTKKKGK